MREISKIPNIYFIQNIADRLHIERHLYPFMRYLDERYRGGDESSASIFIAWFYKITPGGDGHVPADRIFAVNVVRDAIAKFIPS